MSTNENLHPGGFYVNKSCAGLSSGDVVAVFRTYEEWEARKFAQDHGLSTEYITWDQVRMLRVKGPKIGELPEIKGPQIGNPPMGQ